MFKSLHPSKKWKWCQVCAKRKVIISMCFSPQPSWAKEYNQPSRLQSCHVQTFSRLRSLSYQAVISQEYYPNTAIQMLLFANEGSAAELASPLSSVLNFAARFQCPYFLTNLPPTMSACLITINSSLIPLKSSSITSSWHWRTSMTEQWVWFPKDLLISWSLYVYCLPRLPSLLSPLSSHFSLHSVHPFHLE